MTAQILISHTPAEGTLLQGTSKGDGTQTVIKPLGWHYSARISCWYLPRSRDKAPNRGLIEQTATALQSAGYRTETDIDESSRPTAEIEADRLAHERERAQTLAERAARSANAAAAADRSARELSDRMPLGQPILVGHHSQRSMERAYERIGKGWDRAGQAAMDADEATRRAKIAASASGARYKPTTVANRIQSLEAELRDLERRLEGHQRTLFIDSSGRRHIEQTHAATGERRERLLQQQAQLADQLGYWQQVRADQLAAGEALDVSPANLTKGDHIKVRGRWHEVVRVNAKSVTVPSGLGSWTQTVRYSEISARRPTTTS